MATQIQANKIYRCQSPQIACGSFEVFGSSTSKAKIYGSNVTEYTTDGRNRLITPSAEDFIATGDEMEPGIHLIAGMPEWFVLTGDFTDCWLKMGADVRIEPVDVTITTSSN